MVPDVDALIARTPQQIAQHLAIEARIRHDVTEIDIDRGAVRVRGLDEGDETCAGFDRLMVATGARPIHPDLPGIDA